jgi:hypothetical protein
MWASLASGISFLNSVHFAGEWRLRHFEPMTQGFVESSDGSMAAGARLLLLRLLAAEGGVPSQLMQAQ